MPNLRRLTQVALLPALAVAGLSFSSIQKLDAADHFDSPARTDPLVDTRPDTAADIADVYAFFDATNLVVIMTFAGPQPMTMPATYDRDVLYTINLSNAGDRTDAEFPIQFRFGFDANNNPGVQITGLPGSGVLVGPVETNLTTPNGIMVRAGLFDDPFFFDLQGFRETRNTGTLRFNNQRDFFLTQNDTAIVIQIPRTLIENGSHTIDIWGTTARFGGQL